MTDHDRKMLRDILLRIGLKVDAWGEGEYIALTEHGPTGGTLSRMEALFLDRILQGTP